MNYIRWSGMDSGQPNVLVQHDAFRIDKRPPARYRVTWTQYGAWYVEDRVSGLTTYGGETWADAMRHVAARYDRLRRAQDYMHNFHPDQVDADEVIYAPGGWANG